jgi:hypothetical protein
MEYEENKNPLLKYYKFKKKKEKVNEVFTRNKACNLNGLYVS